MAARTWLILFTVGSLLWDPASGHGGSAHAPPCDASANPVHVIAPYVPGTLTVDGNSSEWDSVDGYPFVMLQAISPDPEQPYGGGQMSVKVAHDGIHLFVLLQAPGKYVWNSTSPHLAPSVALMFGIGDDATFYNMGGCPNLSGACTSASCQGHEVDLMHFQLSTAIPGRLYGSNLGSELRGTGRDSVGHLDDLFAWNPHCIAPDGPPMALDIPEGSNERAALGAGNDWKGAWSHSAVPKEFGLVARDAPFGTEGEDGVFMFEFMRPLRTRDQFQQDAQFTIGESHRFGAALWYPSNGIPWAPSQHFVLSCDWLSLDLYRAPHPYSGWAAQEAPNGLSNDMAAALAALAFLMALSAMFVSMVVGWWVRANSRQFEAMPQL